MLSLRIELRVGKKQLSLQLRPAFNFIWSRWNGYSVGGVLGFLGFAFVDVDRMHMKRVNDLADKAKTVLRSVPTGPK